MIPAIEFWLTTADVDWVGEKGSAVPMETIELADGGLLLYDDAFLAPDLAQRYFVELRDHCA
jgi:hypothetical protein